MLARGLGVEGETKMEIAQRREVGHEIGSIVSTARVLSSTGHNTARQAGRRVWVKTRLAF